MKNAKHLALVRSLPCVACAVDGREQCSPTEAHHTKSGRYGTRKTADDRVIPLCHSHHNKLRPYPGDESVIGYHNGQEAWEAVYGPDTDYIDATRMAVEMLD